MVPVLSGVELAPLACYENKRPLPLPLASWSRSPLNENAVNAVNAAFVRCRGFAPAPLAAYYWDGVPLMKKLSRACLVEQLRHTFTTERADLGPNSPFGLARSHCSQYRWPGAAVFGAQRRHRRSRFPDFLPAHWMGEKASRGRSWLHSVHHRAASCDDSCASSASSDSPCCSPGVGFACEKAAATTEGAPMAGSTAEGKPWCLR